MMYEPESFIDKSISPVIHHEPHFVEASSGEKELVESDEMMNAEVIPVPEAGEEFRQPRVGRRPMAPTKAEIEEHYPLHLNYRSWCEHCRAGKGRQDPHLLEPHDREKLGITFNADYAFLTPEEREEDMQPSLVMLDDDKEAFWAIGVETKGPSEPVVKYVRGILEQSGYEGQKIAFKTDQEPSIVALKRAIAALRVGETVPIESPVRASKSNGKMEGAIGRWQAQLRTVKHFAESKLGRRIEVGGPLFSWLIPYVTEIMNKFKVGPDGRTAYERITGHKCRHIGIGFAENVDFMLEPDKTNLQKADSKWMTGVFLGYIWRSTEYIIGTAEGIYKCRTVRRKNIESSYDPKCTEFMSVTYSDYVLKDAKSTVIVPRFPGGVSQPEELPQKGRSFAPRRVYTKPSDYSKHGYTQGCRGCTWMENQIGPRAGHSEECRARMEKAIAEDKEDDRTKKAKERADHYMYVKTAPENEPRAKNDEGADDPHRESEPNQPPATPVSQKSAEQARAEFDIGTPGRTINDDMNIDGDELDEGPNIASEKRVKTPVRAPATKRKIGVHDEEQPTKVIIRDDGDDEVMVDEAAKMECVDSVRARKEDEEILCKAILGKSIHETYSNDRIKLAVDRQSVECLNKQMLGVDVMEVFSPERVGKLCKEYGLDQGMAMDIKSGFDFDKSSDRAKCWEAVKRDKPTLVIGSPPCTLFSRLQELNKYMYRTDRIWMAKYEELLLQAKRYVKFCTEIYEYQRANGPYFLHEHPWLATSWGLDCVARLEAYSDVRKVQTHMCQFGMVSRTGGVGSALGPVLKPTGFLTNCPAIARELAVKCRRDHDHVNLVGGRAAGAAIYPPGLCRAICRGLAAQLREDKSGRATSSCMDVGQLKSCVERLLSISECCQQATGTSHVELVDSLGRFALDGIQVETLENGVETGRVRLKQRPGEVYRPTGSWPGHWGDFTHEVDGHGLDAKPDDIEGEAILNKHLMSLYVQHGVEVACDDVSGALLDPNLIHEARSTEIDYFKNMGVYERVPRSEQLETRGKIIGTKWIDTNKGDCAHPKIRSRLVGKEFRTGPDDALYASTPPLEALRLIVSRAATYSNGELAKEVMVNDVSRAHFYAKCSRCLYVELPKEDPEAHPDFLGRLRLCLYGTRDAALCWQQTLADHLLENGFTRGIGHPSVFFNEKRDVWTLVHGDDYCSTGSSESLDWLQDVLEARYEIKTQRVGVGKDRKGDDKLSEGQVLNRVIRRTARGYELEADLRHAELIVEQLELTECKAVSTAGVDVDIESAAWAEEPEGEELAPAEATRYRAIGARCNYLQPDRPDIQYAVKEVCRLMSRPTARAWELLKRVGRYLKGRPRLVWQYNWQAPVTVVDITSDANWAGCRRSRKSTSGATIMLGTHLIRAYSKTQSVVAKSSGESELYAIIRASTEGLGIVTLLEDFGVKEMSVSIGIDATAAMGMAQRVGLNKVRHVEVDVLWIQEQQARKLFPLRKIPGPRNPSDLCTKNVPASLVEQYMEQISVRPADGRAAVAQQLHILHDNKLVNASGEVGVLLIPVIGGQANPSVNASSSGGAQLGEVTGGRGLKDSGKGLSKKKSAEERCVDSWESAGVQGKWIRRHRTPRRSLFTPHRVSGGPAPGKSISTSRVTRGRFIRSGRAVVIEDDYSTESDAHRLLDGAWTGVTEFNVETNSSQENITKEVVADGDKDIYCQEELNKQECISKPEPESSLPASDRSVYAASSGCRRGPSSGVAWADCADSDGEVIQTQHKKPGGSKDHRVKQPLSSLSARVAGSARAVLRPGNGMGRRSAGISRSEMSEADSAAAPARVSRSSRNLGVGSAPNHPFAHDRFSSSLPRLRVVGEGECQRWHGQIGGHMRNVPGCRWTLIRPKSRLPTARRPLALGLKALTEKLVSLVLPPRVPLRATAGRLSGVCQYRLCMVAERLV